MLRRGGSRIYKATSKFWEYYHNLPPIIQELADKNFELLKRDSDHPSLNLKKVGEYWVARVGLNYRAMATLVERSCRFGMMARKTPLNADVSVFSQDRERSSLLQWRI